ncbi:hypothetical protein EDD17DRAFT_1071930 [Pisolithus thermaeus]|nr:hypothetical protein EDD17DRAFT_1071930 [Pisolithus thermaeus]
MLTLQSRFAFAVASVFLLHQCSVLMTLHSFVLLQCTQKAKKKSENHCCDMKGCRSYLFEHRRQHPKEGASVTTDRELMQGTIKHDQEVGVQRQYCT